MTAQSGIGNQVGTNLSYILDATSTAESVAASSTNIFQILIDATNHSTEDVYLRLYDVALAPTVGTDDVDGVFPCKKGKTQEYVFRKGVTFGNGIFAAVVTQKGATTGSTSPTGTVSWRMLHS